MRRSHPRRSRRSSNGRRSSSWFKVAPINRRRPLINHGRTPIKQGRSPIHRGHSQIRHARKPPNLWAVKTPVSPPSLLLQSLHDVPRAFAQALEAAGFGSWTRGDYSKFLKGAEKHGRDKISLIAEEVATKTPEEVPE